MYERAVAALEDAGGYLCNAAEKESVRDTLWVGGRLNRKVIAKDACVLAEVCGLGGGAAGSKFFMVEGHAVDSDSRFADEKLFLVLTIYRAMDMDDVVDKLKAILDVCGKGHSVDIHTGTAGHATRLAEEIDMVRVLVNQATPSATGAASTTA